MNPASRTILIANIVLLGAYATFLNCSVHYLKNYGFNALAPSRLVLARLLVDGGCVRPLALGPKSARDNCIRGTLSPIYGRDFARQSGENRG